MLTDLELSQLYTQYGFHVHRRCQALLRHPEDAEDATQETFLRVKRYGIRAEGPTLAWLYTVTSNVCFDLMKRRGREQPMGDEALQRMDARHDGSPDDADRRAVIGAVLRSLDGKTREIGVLHFLDGYTQEEVATQTGYSRRTVGKKLKSFEDLFRRLWTSASARTEGRP